MFEENILKVIFFNLKEKNKITLDPDFQFFLPFFFLEMFIKCTQYFDTVVSLLSLLLHFFFRLPNNS